MSLLLFLYLLSIFSFLCLFRIFWVYSHEHLILLESLQSFKIFIVKAASKLVVIWVLFFIQIELSHHILLPSLEISHRVTCYTILVQAILSWIDYQIEFERCHHLPDELVLTYLCSDSLIV